MLKTACNLQAAPWRHCYQPLIRRSKRRTCSWPCSWEGPTVSPCFSWNFWKTRCWNGWWTWWKLHFWLSFAHQWHVKCQRCQFVTVFLGWWYVCSSSLVLPLCQRMRITAIGLKAAKHLIWLKLCLTASGISVGFGELTLLMMFSFKPLWWVSPMGKTWFPDVSCNSSVL